MGEYEDLLDQCKRDGSFERLLVRARRRWRRSEPACSNDAAAEAEGKPLFAYDPVVMETSNRFY